MGSSIGSLTENVEKSQVELLRKLTLMGGFLFLFWGVIIHLTEGLHFEVWWLRIAISTLFIVLWWFSGRHQMRLRTYEWCISALGAAGVAYAFFISYRGGLHPTWIIGSILIIVGGLSFLSLPGPTMLFSVLSILVSMASFSFHQPDPRIANASIVVNFVTAVFLGIYSSVQRRNLIDQITRAEKNHETILSNMREGVVLHAADGRILEINEATPVILGLTRDQIVGKSNIDPQWKTFKADGSVCQPEEHPSAVAQRTCRPVIGYPLRVVKADGTSAWLSVTAVPIFKADQAVDDFQAAAEGTVVTIQDVTREKLADELIEKQRTSLMVASRLTSLGEMAAGIAHEINNPLAVIGTRAAVMEKRAANKTLTDSDLKKGLEQIQNTVYRMAKIVNSMKALSRQADMDTFEAVALRQILDDTVVVSQEKFQKLDVRLTIEAEEGLMVQCHAGQMGQAILNLLNNAADAIRDLSDRWIRIEAKSTGSDQLQIRVIDSGGGISDGIRDKIFTPFFTTKPSGQGTGLGLSLVQTIVQSHRGRLFLDQTSSFTCFVVEIPKTQFASPALKG